jgi:ariadne-1
MSELAEIQALITTAKRQKKVSAEQKYFGLFFPLYISLPHNSQFFHCIFQTREVIRLQKLQRKLKHASKQSAPPPAVADSEHKLAPSPLCPICANPIRTKQIIKPTAQKTVLKVSSALERRDAALAYKVEQWLTANNASPSASNISMSANINEEDKTVHMKCYVKSTLRQVKFTINYNQELLGASTVDDDLEDVCNFNSEMISFCFSSDKSKTINQLLDKSFQIVVQYIKASSANASSEDEDNSDDNANDNSNDEDSESDSDEYEYPSSDDEEETKSISVQPTRIPSTLSLLRQVSYESGDDSTVMAVRAQMLHQFSSLTNMSPSDSALLLRYARYNLNTALQYWRENSNDFKRKAGVHVAAVVDSINDKKNSTKQDIINTTLQDYSLGCGHEFCEDCWTEYLTQAVRTVPCTALDTECMQLNCSLKVGPQKFQQIFSSSSTSTTSSSSSFELMKRYNKAVVQSFVDEQQSVCWCPTPGCEMAILGRSSSISVQCGNGHIFCFSCGNLPHSPTNCTNARNFLDTRTKKHSPEAKLSRKLSSGIKPCPNPDCGCLTEKISGCMYLQCAKCTCHWCWKCGGYGLGRTKRPAPHHVHDCNLPVNEEWNSTSSNLFDNDGRFLWYMERYDNHQNSLQFALKSCETISAQAEDLEASGIMISCEFLKDAVNLLVDCRRLLAWTYACAFFIVSDSDRERFQFQQLYLEETTEKLHGLVESMVKEMSVPQGGPANVAVSSTSSTFVVNMESKKMIVNYTVALGK